MQICLFKKKIKAEKHPLKFHSDGDGGILVFIYLNGVNSETGATRFLPGTHEIGLSLQIGNNVFIDEKHYRDRLDSVQVASGGPGTALFFDQDIWHDLPPYPKGGREVIWCLYQPASRNLLAYDALLRQSHLESLTDRQLQCLGVGAKAFSRSGSLKGDPAGANYHKGHIKIFFTRILISLIKSKIAPDFKPSGKPYKRLPRIRAKHP